MIYICYRDHITKKGEIPDEEWGGTFLSCSKIEESKQHRNYGKVCERLCFRQLDHETQVSNKPFIE